MVQCGGGHQICFECIEKQVNEILYGGLRAHGSLSCISISHCKKSIYLSEIRKVIPNDVVERYEYPQAQDALSEAKIKNLIYCPFCSVPYEIDKCALVLDCPNSKCLKASCIQCWGFSSCLTRRTLLGKPWLPLPQDSNIGPQGNDSKSKPTSDPEEERRESRREKNSSVQTLEL